MSGYYWFYRLILTNTNGVTVTQVFDDYAPLLLSINPGIELSTLKAEVDGTEFDVLLDKGEYKIMRTSYPTEYERTPIE